MAIKEKLKTVEKDNIQKYIISAPSPVIYAALFTDAPTDQGGGTEVIGGGYARCVIEFAAGPDDPVLEETSVINSNTVNFPTATASWGTVISLGLFDAALGGNLLYYSDMAASQTIDAGEKFSLPAGQVKITEPAFLMGDPAW